MSTKPLIMISHASENLELATALADALDEEDLKVWLAARDISIGSNFAEEISRTISSADFLVVLLSPESLTSPHVKREVNMAITMGKKLLPVLSSDSSGIMNTLPYDWNYWLSLAQAIPFTDLKSTASRIAATIHRDRLTPEIEEVFEVSSVIVPERVVPSPPERSDISPAASVVREPDGVIRVLVVDDHPIFRLGVCDRVKGIGSHVELVGEAADGFAARELAAALHPHIILMDLNMPGISGIETTRNIKADFPTIQVIILSASAEIDEINEALKAGASGFLLKSVTGPELEAAIFNVAGGGSVLSPSVTRSLLTDLKTTEAYSEELSERELGIMQLMMRGETNKSIGEELALNMRAVEAHLHSIFLKLGVTTRADAISHAVRDNLITAIKPN